MSPDTTRLRLGVVGIVVVALFAALLARLWYLQVVAAPSFRVQAEGNRLRLVSIEAPRGRILDRRGRPLVDNRATNAITVSRAELAGRSRQVVLGRLATLLAEPLPKVQARVDDPRFSPYKPVPIALDVDKDKLVYISEHQSDFPGVEGVRLNQREYPQGPVAAHLLGYVGEINERELASHKSRGYKLGDTIGKSGVEAIYEDDLRGRPGIEELEVDSRGQVLPASSRITRAPEAGRDVQLTLDLDVQKLAEDSLAQGLAADRVTYDKAAKKHFLAPAGAVVVLDPRDGSVLALASNPTYDPSKFIGGIKPEDFKALQDPANYSPLTDRAIQGQYAPGSTFKLVTSLAAMTKGLINANFTLNDTGSYVIGGSHPPQRRFNALHEAHGLVDLVRAITVSSDVYFYRLGDLFWQSRNRFGVDAIQDTARSLGLGSRTGIPLPSEATGLVSSPETRKALHDKYPKAYPNGVWYAGDNVNLAIGQGELSVTPLQLANAYATFANGGTVYQPRVADSIHLSDGTKVRDVTPRPVRTVPLPPEVRDPILRGLDGVVSDPHGTAYGTFGGFPLSTFPVAGKTGTAQVVGKQDTAIFTAFAPVNAPQFVVTVVMEEAGFGADAAAPVARRILEGLAGHPPQPVSITGGPPD